MRELAERAYFLLCRALGRLLRSARYAKVCIVAQDGEVSSEQATVTIEVRKK